jgi:hypothetical protein
MTERLTQADINRRHMESMGLDPDTLGKPYSSPQSTLSDAERCEEVYDGFRCARTVGHSGIHVRGGLKWGVTEEVNDYTAGGTA